MDPLALRSSQLPVCAARLRCRTALGQGDREGMAEQVESVHHRGAGPLVVVSQRLTPKGRASVTDIRRSHRATIRATIPANWSPEGRSQRKAKQGNRRSGHMQQSAQTAREALGNRRSIP
jgi:hypothetical protein